MLPNLELFLIISHIVLRLLAPMYIGVAGAGMNMLIDLLVWLALVLHLACRRPADQPLATCGFYPAAGRTLLATFNWFPFLFALFVIYGLAITPYKFGGFGYAFSWVSNVILFYLVIALGRPRLFLGVLVACGTAITFQALYQHLWGLDALRQAVALDPALLNFIPQELRTDFMTRLSANEPFGPFTYQNSLGGFLALLIPIILSGISRYGGKHNAKPRQNTTIFFLLSLIFLLMAYVLWATGARGAWVSAVFGILIFLLLRVYSASKTNPVVAGLPLPLLAGVPSEGEGQRTRSPYNIIFSVRSAPLWQRLFLLFLAITILIGIVLFAYILVTPEVPGWLNNISPSLSVRYGYWRGAWAIIRDNPFGIGINAFADHYLIYKEPLAGITQKTHNDYLQIGAETGIIGLLIFVAFFLGTIVKSIITSNQHRVASTPSSVLGAHYSLLGLVAGLAGFLLHCTVDFNFYVSGLSMSAWLVAAIILSYRRLTEPVPTGHPVGGDAENAEVSAPALLVARYSPFGAVIRHPCGDAHLSLLRTIGTLVLLVVVFLLSWFVCLPLLEYDGLMESGKDKIRSQQRIDGVAELIRARAINPYAVEPDIELAWFQHNTGGCFPHPRCFVRDGVYPSGTHAPPASHTPSCIEYMSIAIELSPLSSMLYEHMSILYKSHAASARESGNVKLSVAYEALSRRYSKLAQRLNPDPKLVK